jgi:hypothetical protein
MAASCQGSALRAVGDHITIVANLKLDGLGRLYSAPVIHGLL